MGHKGSINRLLRLGITQEHRSRWYAPCKTIALPAPGDQSDSQIHHTRSYASAGISDVLIARKGRPT